MGLDTVELLMHVEREFGIDIPNEEAATLETVGDLAACVIRHAPGAEPADVLARVTRILVEEFLIPTERVRPQARIVRDLGLD